MSDIKKAAHAMHEEIEQWRAAGDWEKAFDMAAMACDAVAKMAEGHEQHHQWLVGAREDLLQCGMDMGDVRRDIRTLTQRLDELMAVLQEQGVIVYVKAEEKERVEH